MRHLTDGTLRRMVDEPLALAAADQEHHDGCAECKTRRESIADDARTTAGLLSIPSFDPQPRVALTTLQMRLRKEAPEAASWRERWLDRSSPSRRRVTGTGAVALVAAGLLVAFTVSGVAASFFKIFEPKSVAPITVSPSAVNTIAAILDYGPISWTPGPPKAEQVADAATAQRLSGLPILMPGSVPKGISGTLSYGVISQATGSLTFDSARLRASAAKQHVQVGAMPSSIDHSTIYVNGGPALIEVWATQSGDATQRGVPQLVIVQTKAPTVYSTGASAADLQNYLLSQPGVPPEIAAQLRAIKDPSSTLPIPIPQGLATSTPVTVNGAPGLLINATLVVGVVWQKGDVIYAVGGQVTPDQALAIASTLH